MTTYIELDFETKSIADLKKVGTWRYSIHESTEVLLASWSVNQGPEKTWYPGLNDELLEELFELVREGAVIIAWKADFEYAIWLNVCHVRMGWPMPGDDQWICAMACALRKAIPGKLENAGYALKVPIQKDKVGHALMLKHCKPRKPRKDEDPNGVYWHEMDEFGLTRLGVYCADDIRSERGILKRVGLLPGREQQVWRLDQEINRRGIRVDVDFAEAGIACLRKAEVYELQRLRELTSDQVQTAGQVKKIKDWVNERLPRGHLPDLGADTVEMTLERDDVPLEARQVLEIRQRLSRSSVKKLQRALDCLDPIDMRVRYLLQYHKATTGRWAGQLLQPHNLPRPRSKIDNRVIVEAVLNRDVDTIEMLFGNPFDIVADAMRGIFIPDPGKALAWGDFSSIESVLTAALAGEEWKIQLFRDGRDPYCEFASKVVGREVTKNDPERQDIGKPGELSGGYQGWVGAWRKFDKSDTWTDEEVAGHMSVWRDLHPMIRTFWHEIENAATQAVARQKPWEYRGIVFRPEGEWLTCRLLSGRKLWYTHPWIEVGEDRFGREKPVLFCKAWRYGKWRALSLYGGLLTENIVQATARDMLVDALFRVDRAAWPIVMHVHDEIVTEMPKDLADPQVLHDLMGDAEPWCRDWPVGVSVKVRERYEK